MAAPPAPPAQAYAAPNTPIAYIHDPEAAFEDAPDDHSAPAAAADAPAELELAHDEEDDDEDVYWDEDDEDEEWAQLGAVEDEDWGGHEKDFSKQYNRLKQYQSAVSNPAPQPTRAGPSAASGSGSGGLKQHSSSAVRSTPLPAINRSRPAPALASSSSNASAAASSSAGPTTAVAESRLARLINLAPYAPSPTVNTKAAADRQNQKDKSDRATVEQVLDARTRLVLAKLINKGLVGAVEGCVSTGKEANVYHAWPPATPPVPTAHNPNPPVLPKQIALKIFKTSILVFKDREKYITGEFRFKGGQSKNPRKMVRMWAEKEMRNLKRLEAAGVRCPRSLEVRENVLAMEFLGDADGWPSLRLKDAEKHMSLADKQEMYAECMVALRTMYQVCRLVHADLSEYNILWHLQHMYIIDVSQSVEHDHPHAFDFLRSDLTNIAAFFRKCSAGSVRVLGLRKAFEFVTWGDVGEGRFVAEGGEGAEGEGADEEREREKRRWEQAQWERCLGEWLDAGAGAGQAEDDEDDDNEAKPNAVEEGETELVDEFASTAIDRPAAASSSSSAAPRPAKSSASSAAGPSSAKHANKTRRSPQFSADLPADARELDAAQDDLVFKSAYIPRSLADVWDPERDVDAVNRGEGSALEYVRAGGVGIVGVTEGEEGAEDGSASGSDDDDDDDSDSDDEEDADGKPRPPKPLRGHRNEDRDAKKARKKAAKDEAAEKRKTKMPKKVKKRKVNQGKHDR